MIQEKAPINEEKKPSKLKIKKISAMDTKMPHGGWCVHNQYWHCCGVTLDRYVCFVA
jgi:hypothetical protein